MEVSVVKVSKKGRKAYGALSLPKDATVEQLKVAFEKHARISRHRQGFKFEAKDKLVSLTDDAKTLKEYGVAPGAELQFKDFGPQMGYRTVFVLEYLGPLLFVLFYSTRPAFLYGPDAAAKPMDRTAWLGVLCWTTHFCKREFETFFVHRFSRATMPLRNLFKNCTYYWTFGAVIGYPLCHPDYTAPTSELQVQVGLAIFAVAEILNACVHLQFRFMRPAEGSQLRPIPKGPLFALVSCPNYFFEVLGWVGFSIFTQIFFNYCFTIAGLFQMALWALKKHHNYLKTYGDEYKKLRRKAIIPFIL